MKEWSEYVNSLTQGVPQKTVADRVGVNQSTINRWINGASKPRTPAEAAALAVAFRGNVLEAFVAAGYLTAEQAGTTPIPPVDLSDVESEELANEVSRRLVGRLQPVLDKFEQVSEKLTALEERRAKAKVSEADESLVPAADDVIPDADESPGGSE